MRKQQMSLVLFTLAICLCIAASAQQTGRVESMKLLAPDAGWDATKRQLFWTTDGGAQWKGITPKLDHKEQSVSSIFFLDVSTGWVLLHCGDGRDPKVDDVCMEAMFGPLLADELLATPDGGATWIDITPGEAARRAGRVPRLAKRQLNGCRLRRGSPEPSPAP